MDAYDVLSHLCNSNRSSRYTPLSVRFPFYRPDSRTLNFDLHLDERFIDSRFMMGSSRYTIVPCYGTQKAKNIELTRVEVLLYTRPENSAKYPQLSHSDGFFAALDQK